jgi:hypothetical protein
VNRPHGVHLHGHGIALSELFRLDTWNMQEAWMVAKRQAAKSARVADTKAIVTIISEMKINLYGSMQEAWLVAKRQAAKSARDADTKPIVTIISEMKMNGSRNRVIFLEIWHI